ncbi:MAG: hypothetical protein AAF830_11240 [Pseudomonadota bacterium]
MAYAADKIRKADRDIRVTEIAGFALAAAIGIGVAVIVDLFQHREASALYVINRTLLDVTSLLGIEAIPLYGVMLLLMAAGAGMVMYFQPVTARGAFTQGFGALATLVTLAPSDLGAPLYAPMDDMLMMDESFDFGDEDDGGLPGGAEIIEPATDGDGMPMDGEEASLELEPLVIPASLAMVQPRPSGNDYQMRIKIEFPNGLKSDLQTMVRRGTLGGKIWNPDTQTAYNLFRNSGARMAYRDDTLRIETVVPGVDSSAQLWILVEADGYAILEEGFNARAGANRIWTVEMEPSTTPLFIQRLRHSYRF